ncbi:MAG: hypothetical protein GY847_38085 [Proteobacteria bacterium]|nr:hypothetical protein [Pseudomonadota bacterium]
MKIKKTNGSGSVTQTARTKGNAASQKQSSNLRPSDVGDTVSLSSDALAVRQANETEISAVEKVEKTNSKDGSLPDPRATSQAILEKELAQVFREIYL